MKMKLNKKGFTLAELLIVVAIIAVLVAISVPIFSAQLTKARQATNVANIRSAKSAAISEYLLTAGNTATQTYVYDVAGGTVTTGSTSGTSVTTGVLTEGGSTEADGTKVYTKVYVTVSSGEVSAFYAY